MNGQALNNSEVIDMARKTQKNYTAKSMGEDRGSHMLSYTFGRYQAVWSAGAGEVRDMMTCNAVVFRGGRDECIGWCKLRCG